MSETLTYTEESSPELNAQEQESLALGEQMQQEQESLLAGKYNSPEALEKAYLELQQKLGSNEETTAESVEEPTDEPAEEEPAADTGDAELQEPEEEEPLQLEGAEEMKKAREQIRQLNKILSAMKGLTDEEREKLAPQVKQLKNRLMNKVGSGH